MVRAYEVVCASCIHMYVDFASRWLFGRFYATIAAVAYLFGCMAVHGKGSEGVNSIHLGHWLLHGLAPCVSCVASEILPRAQPQGPLHNEIGSCNSDVGFRRYQTTLMQASKGLDVTPYCSLAAS